MERLGWHRRRKLVKKILQAIHEVYSPRIEEMILSGATEREVKSYFCQTRDIPEAAEAERYGLGHLWRCHISGAVRTIMQRHHKSRLATVAKRYRDDLVTQTTRMAKVCRRLGMTSLAASLETINAPLRKPTVSPVHCKSAVSLVKTAAHKIIRSCESLPWDDRVEARAAANAALTVASIIEDEANGVEPDPLEVARSALIKDDQLIAALARMSAAAMTGELARLAEQDRYRAAATAAPADSGS